MGNLMTNLQTVWKNQPLGDTDMVTMADIRERALKFQTQTRWRGLVLYAYSAFNIAAGLWLVVAGRLPKYSYPMLLMIVAHLFVLWQVNRRVSTGPIPEELGQRTVLENYQRQLDTQRYHFQHAWLWYIAPFMPALIWELVLRGMTVRADVPLQVNRLLVLYPVAGAMFFWMMVWLFFSRAALKLELEIERLKRVIGA